MNKKDKQPLSNNSVLGRQSRASYTYAIKQELEKIKKIVSDETVDNNTRIATLQEAINYGQPGFDIILYFLDQGKEPIKKAAFDILLGKLLQQKERIEKKIQEITYKYYPNSSPEEPEEDDEDVYSTKLEYFEQVIKNKNETSTTQLKLDEEEILHKVKITLAQQLARDIKTIYPEQKLTIGHLADSLILIKENDLVINDIEALEFLLAIEELFAIRITDDEVEKITTVTSLVKLIQRKLKHK